MKLDSRHPGPWLAAPRDLDKAQEDQEAQEVQEAQEAHTAVHWRPLDRPGRYNSINALIEFRSKTIQFNSKKYSFNKKRNTSQGYPWRKPWRPKMLPPKKNKVSTFVALYQSSTRDDQGIWLKLTKVQNCTDSTHASELLSNARLQYIGTPSCSWLFKISPFI